MYVFGSLALFSIFGDTLAPSQALPLLPHDLFSLRLGFLPYIVGQAC